MAFKMGYFVNRMKEKLWIKPLFVCVFSVILTFAAKAADQLPIESITPDISKETIETLLSIMAASMLVIATFSVSSMVSAFASASSTATPRSFPLVVSDDVSQNALSMFVGAFIFSIVALIAIKNGFFDKVGRFSLFSLTLISFAIVIVTFIRWVDSIARLGRLGSTIEKVETATINAMNLQLKAPRMGAHQVSNHNWDDEAIYSDEIGYIQNIDMPTLQSIAESLETRIRLNALPGTFSSPGLPLAYIEKGKQHGENVDKENILNAFCIGKNRVFDEDPRFGLVVLSEIASKALSPGINDSGTAIGVIGALVRILKVWDDGLQNTSSEIIYSRLEAPEIKSGDMLEDAFLSISRDGASSLEVGLRLRKAFRSMQHFEDKSIRTHAAAYAALSLKRAKKELSLEEDFNTLEKIKINRNSIST
ncbi:DUF2254 domain-containing protein [Halomonas icarae]|uniref:DUF2254 domain-containing protein n=1 Tax=Halomonas icarae TaxID=2691040 RepID=A0A7X4VY26_9GAMM|nr:DUF2254 domain-containing protein [Halomonas icarae]MDR5900983.1 DUF2254 domain-containing protein [Halomonas icarae]NAW11258.1 DUF2254 domain-containing protein [Halomonas icarae]